MPKQKIVILGGGIAGLSTALELTRPADWQDRIESITLYQMGWRLGGKCASGRGPNGRIEEHGIHLFGGGYYNALGLMAEVYGELGALGWPVTFEDAFKPQYLSLSWTGPVGRRQPHITDFPPNPLRPGDGRKLGDLPASLAAVVELVESMALPRGGLAAVLDGVVGGFVIDILGGTPTPSVDIAGVLGDIKTRLLAGAADLTGLQRALDRADTLLNRYLLPLLGLSPRVAQAYVFADLVLALVRGAVVDRLIKRKRYDDLDRLDWADWLRQHGAGDAALASPLALAPLNILYQYPDGDHQRTPTMGAGAYLHWQLRTLAYLGAPFWFFGAGTGDSVVLPMYALLKHRGVRFEFFHQVEALHLDAAGQNVASVSMSRQAALKDPAAGYDPLVRVKGQLAWPSQPRHEQLLNGDALKAFDLESYWAGPPKLAAPALQAGQDYDRLVFAISLGAVPYLCGELLQHNARWRDMVAGLPTVQTQSLQLWLDHSSADLGLALTPSDPDDTALACGYEAPFDGLADFSPLIGQEDWPAQAPQVPQALWYFSDVMAPTEPPPAPGVADPGYPARARQQARTHSLRFLDEGLRALLPRAMAGGLPDRFNFDRLVPHTGAPTGQARFDQQYWRANVEPSERYVTAPPGSTALRLQAGGSGYANLVLAGDWIYTGLNVGCVEATVMSGMLAANALTGVPALSRIIGYPD